LDIVAKEIFLMDKVLFLEGQEDVGLIQKFIDDNNIAINFSIFGYGSNGDNKIPCYFEIAKNLGICAAAIFDKGVSGEILKAAKNFEELGKFKVMVSPYDDIRYKESKPNNTYFFSRAEKNGEFTIADEKKSELREMISKINNFFDGKKENGKASRQ
jgi:hypothetical protein